jgi:hypothetical protein
MYKKMAEEHIWLTTQLAEEAPETGATHFALNAGQTFD